MASGLMTLAYMGEMAVVFNLAYLELNKERYVKIPKESAQALHKSISDPPGGLGAIDPEVWDRKRPGLLVRLTNMVSETPSERQAAWYFKKNHDSKEQEQVHQDWWAGRTYNIFSNEIDKTFCQWVMIVAALLLVAITILDSLGPKNLFLDSIGMRDYLLKNRAVALATFSIFAFAWVMAVFLFSPKPSGAIITLILLSLVFLTSIGSVPGYDLPEFSIGLWWYFFWLFLLTIIAPMICILLGRQLRTKFEKCIADVKLDFEQIKAKALP